MYVYKFITWDAFVCLKWDREGRKRERERKGRRVRVRERERGGGIEMFTGAASFCDLISTIFLPIVIFS